jgi:carbamoyltransferase
LKSERTTTALAISLGAHDPAVCLARDGDILAHVEEERVLREKHADGKFPSRALREVLDIARLGMSDIDCIAVNWDLPRFEDGRMAQFYADANRGRKVTEATLQWQRRNLQTFTTDALRNRLRLEFERLGFSSVPKIISFPHHDVHAWQAYTVSGFDQANVLVMGGSGDAECSSVWTFDGQTAKQLACQNMPHSLGWFYAAITEYLGYAAYDGEHKVMAMAAFGAADPSLESAIGEMLAVTPQGYELASRYIHDGAHSFSGRFTDALVDLLGMAPKRLAQRFEKAHFDLAFVAQRQLEKAAIAFLRASGADLSLPLCVSGELALNVTLGSRLQREFPAHPVFANPLGADSGAQLGAALRATCAHRPVAYKGSLLLGREYPQQQIEQLLASRQLEWQPATVEAILSLLDDGRLLGWFQGRAEVGPRALGARSILCDPRNETAMAKLTEVMKLREHWQPYGLSMPASRVHEVIAGPLASENMSIAAPVRPAQIANGLKAVHIDGSTRPHVVHQAAQPLLFEVLERFGEQTGVFALINTSFNRRGEPIAYAPRDALSIYLETELDALVIGHCLLTKRQVDA